MEITVHHSGSSGNLYQVDSLLIEAGVPLNQIKKDLNYRLSDIAGCLISHAHGDHAKGLKDLLKCGIDCYVSRETADALCLSGHRLHIVEPLKQFTLGPYRIKPFPLAHDVPCLGFLIARGREKLLFCVDTNYVPYRFKGLTIIALGVDYDAETLKDNVSTGTVDIERAKRTLQNHMSLQTAKAFFRANDMSRVREIYLLHLSDANSNAQGFRDEIQRITGRPVYVG